MRTHLAHCRTAPHSPPSASFAIQAERTRPSPAGRRSLQRLLFRLPFSFPSIRRKRKAPPPKTRPRPRRTALLRTDVSPRSEKSTIALIPSVPRSAGKAATAHRKRRTDTPLSENRLQTLSRFLFPPPAPYCRRGGPCGIRLTSAQTRRRPPDHTVPERSRHTAQTIGLYSPRLRSSRQKFVFAQPKDPPPRAGYAAHPAQPRRRRPPFRRGRETKYPRQTLLLRFARAICRRRERFAPQKSRNQLPPPNRRQMQPSEGPPAQDTTSTRRTSPRFLRRRTPPYGSPRPFPTEQTRRPEGSFAPIRRSACYSFLSAPRMAFPRPPELSVFPPSRSTHPPGSGTPVSFLIRTPHPPALPELSEAYQTVLPPSLPVASAARTGSRNAASHLPTPIRDTASSHLLKASPERKISYAHLPSTTREQKPARPHISALPPGERDPKEVLPTPRPAGKAPGARLPTPPSGSEAAVRQPPKTKSAP